MGEVSNLLQKGGEQKGRSVFCHREEQSRKGGLYFATDGRGAEREEVSILLQKGGEQKGRMSILETIRSKVL